MIQKDRSGYVSRQPTQPAFAYLTLVMFFATTLLAFVLAAPQASRAAPANEVSHFDNLRRN